MKKLFICEDFPVTAHNLEADLRTKGYIPRNVITQYVPYLRNGAIRLAKDVAADIVAGVKRDGTGGITDDVFVSIDLVPATGYGDPNTPEYWFGIEVLFQLGCQLFSTDDLYSILRHRFFCVVISSNFELNTEQLKNRWLQFGGSNAAKVKMKLVHRDEDLAVIINNCINPTNARISLVPKFNKEVHDLLLWKFIAEWSKR